MSKTVLVVITDGRRNYMVQTMASAAVAIRDKVGNPLSMQGIIINDSGDPEYADWLDVTYPSFWSFHHDQRQGMAKTVAEGWARAGEIQDMEYVFHLEEDFLFNEPVIVPHLIDLLEREKDLAQVVLQRQPWNPEEVARGSIFDSDEYVQHAGQWPIDPDKVCETLQERVNNERTAWWVEHNRIFSLNPCLIPRRVIEIGWPAGNEAEMTKNVVEEVGYRMAFWGVKDEQAVTHIGHERAQGWKL